jgi:Flp pilus assembly pilin Flp
MRMRRTREDGATALEFGLIVPIIFLGIFGIIQYGFMFWSLQTASATAREAARSLIVGTVESCTLTRATDLARNPSVGGTPTATATYYDASGAVVPAPVEGGLVEVEVALETLSLNLPFLPLPDGGNVRQTAEARVENVPAVPLAC